MSTPTTDDERVEHHWNTQGPDEAGKAALRALLAEVRADERAKAEKVIVGIMGFIKGMCVALSPPGFRPDSVGGTYIDVLRHLIEKQLGLPEGALK